jgi:hypothetical protein
VCDLTGSSSLARASNLSCSNLQGPLPPSGVAIILEALGGRSIFRRRIPNCLLGACGGSSFLGPSCEPVVSARQRLGAAAAGVELVAFVFLN